jgi:hypothetical protein
MLVSYKYYINIIYIRNIKKGNINKTFSLLYYYIN